MGMSESQKLAMQGWSILKAQGWPEDAIEKLSRTLMEAGYHRCLEEQEAERQRNEGIITSAQQSFRGNVN